jgi:hypothetical protein
MLAGKVKHHLISFYRASFFKGLGRCVSSTLKLQTFQAALYSKQLFPHLMDLVEQNVQKISGGVGLFMNSHGTQASNDNLYGLSASVLIQHHSRRYTVTAGLALPRLRE